MEEQHSLPAILCSGLYSFANFEADVKSKLNKTQELTCSDIRKFFVQQ